MNKSDLDEMFSYHKPEPDQIPKYEAIRAAAKEFAGVLLDNTPQSPDQTVAIRHLRNAVYSANASIALKGQY